MRKLFYFSGSQLPGLVGSNREKTYVETQVLVIFDGHRLKLVLCVRPQQEGVVLWACESWWCGDHTSYRKAEHRLKNGTNMRRIYRWSGANFSLGSSAERMWGKTHVGVIFSPGITEEKRQMNLFPSSSGDRKILGEQKWVSRSSSLLIGRERGAYVLL